MEEAIITYLDTVKNLCPQIRAEELVFLSSGLSVSEMKTKHFYIHANTLQKEIGFVYRGLLRAFYVDQEGNEITFKFVPENCIATDYTALISQKPSEYNFQCLESTVFVNLPYSHLKKAYEKYPNIERYGRLVAEEALKLQQKRIESLLFNNAEKRYLEFMEEQPNLFNRVSISLLSSFLGIKRQSLTRIRKKLATRTI
ncbi:MAG: Crp/Fnr family transcriptional regulator [Chitinophagales bacterium]|nr:Crp/Fnr family transcriptional regulator [Chitinophagales bacterium]